MRRTTRFALASLGLAGIIGGIGFAAAPNAAPIDPQGCSQALQSGATLTHAERYECVTQVASSYLASEAGDAAPDTALLHAEFARHKLGQSAAHTSNGAQAQRDRWAGPGGTVGSIVDKEWTVDGDVAFVAYRVLDETGKPVRHVPARITLKEGLVWEVLENPAGVGAAEQGDVRTPSNQAAAVVGPMHPAVDMNAPDYTSGAYCSLALDEEVELTQEQERSCLQAVAATYIDAEGNEIADSLTLFDPRFSKYSLGDVPNHHPGNGDTNRMDQTYLRPTIRLHDNKQWTIDTTPDTVWIVYDGYLPASTDKPGFYVAERFRIRDGLICEIMISPVIVDVPASLVPSGPPNLGGDGGDSASAPRQAIVAGQLASTTGYANRTVVVTQGSGVDLLNLDGTGHDVVSLDDLFASEVAGTGVTAPIVGVEDLAPGDYAFFCSVHPTMTGAILVR